MPGKEAGQTDNTVSPALAAWRAWLAVRALRRPVPEARYAPDQSRDDAGRFADEGKSSDGAAKAAEPQKTARGLTKGGNDGTISDRRVSLTGEPNSRVDIVRARGGVERCFYGADGRQTLQISNNDHGRKKSHAYGKHGEHAHDYIYDSAGKLIQRTTRELTERERKENEDIL